ncbi:family 78 glycoside hydrolase catalytic domain [Novosphingobium sp. PS1R-30]|uniref:alpha-L-rhamnosidase n=1 Tax=Novosphingobium anseongense TaxID=3133436 RepID=A0ABU8S1I6_9SPHN
MAVEAALFREADWTARPISPAFNVGVRCSAPAPLFRRAFSIDRPVASARLYVTALGLQQCWLNGAPVSADLLEPGWTAYGERHLYATYDVGDLLRSGENVIAGAVGDGWWRGKLTWTNRRAVYGDTTALLAQLEVDFVDGTRVIIATDEQWRATTGMIRSADIYDGCEIDRSLEPEGWREPGFDEREWAPVEMLELPSGLEQRRMPAARIVERLVPRWSRGADIRVDCGQNLTGFLELTGEALTRSRITVRHAEVLEADGSLHLAALRGAKATDVYTVEPGRFRLAPAFTYHGFRHARIEVVGEAVIDGIEACVVSSDLREIGAFSCSDSRIEQLASNIRWSQRGNFVTLPTDCPQRDERMGWTGDIQVFAPTACANYDVRGFLASWLRDLAIEQAGDGQVPSTVPNVIEGHPYEFGGVGWADAAVLVPWALYEAYGDRQVLETQFSSMCAWVDWAASRRNPQGVWRGDFHLGDWLDPGAPPDRPEEATTDRDFIASAYLSFSAGRLARICQVLGREVEAAGYVYLSQEVADASWRVWGQIAQGTQAGCAIAIAFAIAPPAQRRGVGERLADLVAMADGRIGTGFLGTPLVLPALSAAGQHEAAMRLLLNENSPGWLNQVLNGATTMWERWDAITSDGSIHAGDMAAEDAETMMSFNHYAYGSVGAWLYRHLAGLAPADLELPGARPGYRQIRFQPQPGGGIDAARAAIDTPFGTAGIDWRIVDDCLSIRLRVPPGANATFTVPSGWVFPEAGRDAPFGSGEFELLLARGA